MNIKGTIKCLGIAVELDLAVSNYKEESCELPMASDVELEAAYVSGRKNGYMEAEQVEYKSGLKDGAKKASSQLTNFIIETIDENKEKLVKDIASELITKVKYFKFDD